MNQQDFEIIFTGCLVAFSCSLLGCFLILRRMAMVGDAISHAVLPGIVIAYLITGGERESPLMLAGAATIGIVTTLLIELFHKKARLQEDASIGVTFTTLFAIGVILISMYAGQVDLDQECVLYGEIAFTPLNRWITSDGTDLGPEAVWNTGIILLLVSIFITIFYKELKITTFDPAYAAAIGISVGLWHYLLMGFVSLATVGAFKSVGAILVVAFLIAPPATAYLLTDRLHVMLMLSCIAGLISSAGGYYLAVVLNGSVAGGMATVSGILFTIAFLFSPEYGIMRRKLKTQSEH
jgi:manganese/zinc/iron transport system permease protein